MLVAFSAAKPVAEEVRPSHIGRRRAVLLRATGRFKEYQWEQGDSAPTSGEGLAVMTKFERGCGLTLHHAWKHIEAVQTTDIPLMVEHCVRVMHRAVERPGKGSVGEMQPVR